MSTRFLSDGETPDPDSQVSLPGVKNPAGAGGSVDFDALIAEATCLRRCAECGVDLDHRTVPRSAFCSRKHRDAFRHRRRYAENPERERERSRRYYHEHRAAVLDRMAAKRGKNRPAERTTCSECARPLEGRQRVTCGSAGCRDRRFARLHPESYAARERAKVVRRRERRRAGGS